MLQSLTFRFLSAVFNLLIQLIRFRIAAIRQNLPKPGQNERSALQQSSC